MTSIVDVTQPAQLLDVVEGRTAKAPSAWLEARPTTWRNGVCGAALDLSGPYRKTFNDTLPDAVQVADPFHVIKMAWHAKETLRCLYDQPPADAAGYLAELIESLLDRDTMPRELQQLGRTLRRWADQIVAWHQAQVTNGPTEAMDSLIKRVKRVGFGFRRFRNYRLRVLLYAGRPNWDQLATLTPAPPP